MLKTLRVTSIVTVILAVIGVFTIIVLGLKGDPEISKFLEKPGIVDSLRGQTGQTGSEEDKSSPLVALAKEIALRFDPPPPPKPVVPDKSPEIVRAASARPAIPTPKVPPAAKFDLLATVVYKTAPEKSLALLKTSSDDQEWFRQGEKAGRLEIQEIRDGSVVFVQDGGQPQEMFVPEKPLVQALLKGEKATTPSGSGSIRDTLSGLGGAFDAGTDVSTGTSETTSSGTIRVSRPRVDISERIQRVRSTPQPPPPQEQKKQLDKTTSSIEALMKRQDDAIPEEQRKKENEMWMQLLEDINAEKKLLDAQILDQSSGTDEKVGQSEEKE